MLTLLIQFIFYFCTVSSDAVDAEFGSISVQLVLTLLIQFFFFCTVSADPVDAVFSISEQLVLTLLMQSFLFLYS